MSKLTHSTTRVTWSLVIHAYLLLICFDYYLATGDLQGLFSRVRKYRQNRKPPQQLSVALVVAAIDLACVFYWKPVLCLQRAAATTSLMRRHAVDAEMVIGAQRMPFRAHAWVEIHNEIVGERSKLPTSLAILDRC